MNKCHLTKFGMDPVESRLHPWFNPLCSSCTHGATRTRRSGGSRTITTSQKGLGLQVKLAADGKAF
eukprot:scaffold295331_cov32-Prasinocladus_malaysianus.AAC.1